MKKVLSIIFAFAIFTNQLLAQHPAPKAGIDLNQTPEKWREDLKFLEKELPRRHKNPFHAMSREQFEAAVKQLTDKIPNLKNEEIFTGILKILAMVGDGHTSVNEVNLFDFGFYPVHYEIFGDGLFIESIDAEYAAIAGGKVVRIGNTPVDAALARINELAWGDNHNAQSKKVETVFLLTNPRVLQGLKIAESSENVEITVEINGQQKTVELKTKKDIFEYEKIAKRADAAEGSANPLPLYRKHPQNNYWFEYVKESKILYVQFNSVQNKQDENIAAFFKKVFEFAEINPVDKLVLDMRANTGGNNQLNRPIIVGLVKSKLNVRGKLFVVIGRRTFSAAQNLVNEIEKYTDAIFVGEPTGSSPNFYGDPVMITLPNSRIPIRVAALFHQFEPRDTRIWTAPEIFTEMTSTDYRTNRDTFFEAVVNYVPGKTFRDIAAEFVGTKDLPAFVSKYRAFRSDPKNRYVNTEAAMNTFGYQLLGTQKVSEAIEIFKLNTESHPRSANAHDSLAEALLASGNREEAIRAYEKALSIDPNFASSADALRRLRGQ